MLAVWRGSGAWAWLLVASLCENSEENTGDISAVEVETHTGSVQPLDLDILLMIYLEFWNLELAYIKVLVMGLRNDPDTAVSQQQLWS